jgi:hypothetical protein
MFVYRRLIGAEVVAIDGNIAAAVRCIASLSKQISIGA